MKEALINEYKSYFDAIKKGYNNLKKNSVMNYKFLRA